MLLGIIINKMKSKNTFGLVEAIFNIAYLLIVLVISFFLFMMKELTLVRTIASCMSLILVAGDAFHLVPRIMVIFERDAANSHSFLGKGKQISSITMTIFYLLLWHIGLNLFVVEYFILWTVLFYLLGIIRIVICLLPHNKWQEKKPPFMWAIWRNIPFVMMGIMITILFFINRNIVMSLNNVWLAILLSFIFYLPVVLYSHKNAKVGMLMLPKSVMYIWLLLMFVLF
jgi:hypothetical protein